ncbi:peptidoglycan/xylan/chitin deacetylase (PgdA/CDA1 family) [Mycobacterium frederiksbergense]|uniref:Peptidoglycan/xylan/chitin deacetylase (PgdA/CDA1 family) n=1 Tax=Mycolicibacterium frederiksbergense TaxID=117567 RepID=A0ABT6KSS4_9MYCO|nr:polysaccharide deacetylase family protein [Mycolicibacterium frederiksbergense]MDH6193793.1 peptidoglycan/xylan/chitin deacetylase (PgdA/CDA1 family) [Mycolicibacterium frederiksbergense]
MTCVDRRTVLAGITVGVIAALTRAPVAGSIPFPIPPVGAPVGVITRLPGDGNQMALTVDDGMSSPVVGAFAQFCRDTGARLTFFANGANAAWSENAPALRPMVDSGQIQMGNHTWSHPYLNRLPLAQVADQIRLNADFLRNTYGSDGTPYFRPPYGVHNPDIDRVAADQGYTTVTMWSGTIGDSVPENEASLIAAATRSFAPGQIILAHANLPTVTHCFAQLQDLITSRNLQTVTLRDAFG